MKTPAEILKEPYGRVVVPESDGTFRAEIVEFPGCIAAGDTAPEALASLERVAESWLDFTLSKGQPIPAPIGENSFSGKLVLRLPKSLHHKSAVAAKYEGVSLNQFIVSCIAEQIGARSAVTAIFNNPTIAVFTAPVRTVGLGTTAHVDLGKYYEAPRPSFTVSSISVVGARYAGI